MRAKRENTYGVPARILANTASRVRTMQDAHDFDAAHRTPGQHDRPLTHAHKAGCRQCGTHPHARSESGIAPAALDGPASPISPPKPQERPPTPAPSGPDHLPDTPCACVCRWPTMPSGDAPRLTGSCVASRQQLAVLS